MPSASLRGLLGDVGQLGQHLAERRRHPGPQQPPPGRDGQYAQGGHDQPGQHEVGPAGRPSGSPGPVPRWRRTPREQDVQDEGHHLGHPDAGGRDRGRDLTLLQVADVEGGAADRGGRDQGDEGPGHLGQQGAEEVQPLGHEPGQRHGRAHVGRRRQGQRSDDPVPVRRAQHAGQAGPVQFAGQQVGGGDAGHQGQQGAQPDALQPDRGDLAAGHGGQQQRCGGRAARPGGGAARPGWTGPGRPAAAAARWPAARRRSTCPAPAGRTGPARRTARVRP